MIDDCFDEMSEEQSGRRANQMSSHEATELPHRVVRLSKEDYARIPKFGFALTEPINTGSIRTSRGAETGPRLPTRARNC